MKKYCVTDRVEPIATYSSSRLVKMLLEFFAVSLSFILSHVLELNLEL